MAKMTELERIKIAYSPLTKRIRVGRRSVKPGVFLDHKDATDECVKAMGVYFQKDSAK